MEIRFISPREGETVDLHTPELKAWLEARNSGIEDVRVGEPFDYLAPEVSGAERSHARKIPLRWEGEDGPVRVELVPVRYPEEKTVSVASGGETDGTNLRLGETYRCSVTAPDGRHAEMTFKTSSAAPRLLTVPGVSNVRDTGGWQVPGGRVRQGLLIRGGEMETHMTITDEGIRIMNEELRIRTDLDLRGEATIDTSPLGKGKLRRQVMGAYDDLIREDGSAVKAFFDLMGDPGNCPVYVHCWGGADRTGCLVLLWNAAMGVSEEDLLLDYELTSLCIWGLRSVRSDLFRRFWASLLPFGHEGAPLPELCVGYLRSIGVTDAQIRRLRKIYVEQ